jgi:hypothetical protein
MVISLSPPLPQVPSTLTWSALQRVRARCLATPRQHAAVETLEDGAPSSLEPASVDVNERRLCTHHVVLYSADSPQPVGEDLPELRQRELDAAERRVGVDDVAKEDVTVVVRPTHGLAKGEHGVRLVAQRIASRLRLHYLVVEYRKSSTTSPPVLSSPT